MEKLPAAPTEVRPVADAGGRGHMPPRSPRPNFAVAKVCGIQHPRLENAILKKGLSSFQFF